MLDGAVLFVGTGGSVERFKLLRPIDSPDQTHQWKSGAEADMQSLAHITRYAIGTCCPFFFWGSAATEEFW